MSCRDSPACANSSEIVPGSAKARWISSLVMAENRTRETGTVLLTERTMSRASAPMSSPSRSKSVAMMTSSAFLARFFSDWMMPFSASSLSTGAWTSVGRESRDHFLRLTPSNS